MSVARSRSSEGIGQSICVHLVPDHSTAVFATFWSGGNTPTNAPSFAVSTPFASPSLATIERLGASTNMIGPQSDTPQSLPPSAEQSDFASANARVAESMGIGEGVCARATWGTRKSSGATGTDENLIDPDLREEDA